MGWNKLEVESIIPSAVADAPDKIASALSAIDDVLKLVATALDIIDAFSSSRGDPVAAAVKAIVDALKAGLTDLLKGYAGIHFLRVPISPTSKLIESVVLAADSSTTVPVFDISGYIGSGGNLGFYKTVAESCYDRGDPARPQYGPDDPIAGIVCVFGAAQLSDLIGTIIQLGQMLGGAAVGMDSNVVPVPKNVVVRKNPIIPGTPNGTPPGEAPFSVQVSWDPIDATQVLSQFNNSKMTIKNVILYRNTEPFNQHAPNIEQFQIFKSGYDPLVFNILDQDFDPTQQYWYAVGFELAVTDSSGSSGLLGYPSISNVVNFIPTDTASPLVSSNFDPSIPPDWRAVVGLLDLFPEVKALVQFVLSYVNSLDASLGDTTSALKAVSDALRQLVADNEDLIQQLQDLLAQIKAAFKAPPLGLYTLTFSTSHGTLGFLDALQRGLTDASDSNRPPFDTGNELVSGFVLLGGADKIGNFLSLFGGSSDSAGGPSLIQNALNALANLPSAPAPIVLGSDLQPVATGPGFSPPPPPELCKQ